MNKCDYRNYLSLFSHGICRLCNGYSITSGSLMGTLRTLSHTSWLRIALVKYLLRFYPEF